MRKNTFNNACVLALLFSKTSSAQSVSINNNVAVPDSTAMLDVSSTSNGLRIPRMTASQVSVIEHPANGLLVFQTDGEPGSYYFSGTNWFLLVATAFNTDKQNTLIYTSRGF